MSKNIYISLCILYIENITKNGVRILQSAIARTFDKEIDRFPMYLSRFLHVSIQKYLIMPHSKVEDFQMCFFWILGENACAETRYVIYWIISPTYCPKTRKVDYACTYASILRKRLHVAYMTICKLNFFFTMFWNYLLTTNRNWYRDSDRETKSPQLILREKLITEHDTTYLLVYLVEQNTKNAMNTVMTYIWHNFINKS